MNKVIIWNYIPIPHFYYANYTSGTVIYPDTKEIYTEDNYIIL